MRVMKTVGLMTGVMCSAVAFGNGFLARVDVGVLQPHFSADAQRITIQPGLQNQYDPSNPTALDPFVGAGVAYQWDFKSDAVSLGASVYHAQTTAEGVNTPGVNLGVTDSLDYTAQGTNTAVLFEPKFILTQYCWQPYVLTGVGMAWNNFDHYSESPASISGNIQPTQTPFARKSTTDFAYEVGVGIQHPFQIGTHQSLISFDYHYINWGAVSLGDATGANTSLNLGHLATQAVSFGVAYLF